MANKGKTALPIDPETEQAIFPITPAMRAWADKTCPTLDIDHYHEQFLDHWSEGQLKKSWLATWRNWMRRTDDGVAPGLYGRDDKRIVRKKPKPVAQGDLLNAPKSQAERHWEMMDQLREAAKEKGMTHHEAMAADPDELRQFIKETDNASEG